MMQAPVGRNVLWRSCDSPASSSLLVVDCYPVHVSDLEEAGFFVPLLYLVLLMETSLM